jgi:HD-GYP domain-containing protein (c-di-GMP phosphodiesterase class II)
MERLIFLFLWDQGLIAKTLRWHHLGVLTSLTKKISGSLRMQTEEAISLLTGIYCHDIGKLYIPEMILLKADPLNEEEAGIMKQHPIIGEMILRNLGVSDLIESLVLFHHENWDGTGYPYGLRKEEIPLFARIARIVDSVSSMVCDRPYQRAKTLADALKVIHQGVDSSFDPEIVEILLKSMKEEID